MRHVFLGLGVYILGVLVSGLSGVLFRSTVPLFSYLYAIWFSILYLASVVAIVGFIVISKLDSMKHLG